MFKKNSIILRQKYSHEHHGRLQDLERRRRHLHQQQEEEPQKVPENVLLHHAGQCDLASHGSSGQLSHLKLKLF